MSIKIFFKINELERLNIVQRKFRKLLNIRYENTF